jgi:hypothetical protein
MSEVLPIVYLARHGETALSLTGQHTRHRGKPASDYTAPSASVVRKDPENAVWRIHVPWTAGIVYWRNGKNLPIIETLMTKFSINLLATKGNDAALWTTD